MWGQVEIARSKRALNSFLKISFFTDESLYVDKSEYQPNLLQLLHDWFLVDMKEWDYEHRQKFLSHLSYDFLMSCQFLFPGYLIKKLC